jgi:hypothetical protein
MECESLHAQIVGLFHHIHVSVVVAAAAAADPMVLCVQDPQTRFSQMLLISQGQRHRPAFLKAPVA